MENKEIANWELRFTAFMQLHGQHDDGSHDLGHFQRVWRAARAINRAEGMAADPLILLTAAYFHDLVALPKNHPDRASSSRLSAEKTAGILQKDFPDFPPDKIEGVRHAIHAHSFSARVTPLTAEARILQDADRLEALGAIGLARVFYTAGQLNQQLFDPMDPLARRREPDDQQFSLDHFQVKLLKLPALMNTVTGRRMAEESADYLRSFLVKIGDELGVESCEF